MENFINSELTVDFCKKYGSITRTKTHTEEIEEIYLKSSGLGFNEIFYSLLIDFKAKTISVETKYTKAVINEQEVKDASIITPLAVTFDTKMLCTVFKMYTNSDFLERVIYKKGNLVKFKNKFYIVTSVSNDYSCGRGYNLSSLSEDILYFKECTFISDSIEDSLHRLHDLEK